MATPPATTKDRPARKSARPKHLAQGRWLGDFARLSAAEARLVACCARGEDWFPTGWNEKRPEKPTAENTILAGLIRFLALGGDALRPVHEAGVMLHGAWIEGLLDLHQCRASVQIDLRHCHFDAAPVFVAAHLPELSLSGSHVPGLDADRLTVTGGVFLDEGFTAEGEVRLLGATIGGDLACRGGSFANAKGHALSADGIKVTGTVFLREGFTAEGEVRLLGATIGGDLACSGGSFANAEGHALNADGVKVSGNVFLRGGFTAVGQVRLLGAAIGCNLACSGGSFANAKGDALSADGIKVSGDVFLGEGFTAEGQVRLVGAAIGGDLACSGGSFANAKGYALGADRVKVTGSLFLRNARIKGSISLAAAVVGGLIDDSACWQSGGHILDGLCYDRIIGPTDAPSRIAWLKRQRADHLNAEDWKPQPWEQLIKVLREMGHPAEAAEVAMEKQRMMRAAGRIGIRQPSNRFKQPGRRWLDAKWTILSNGLSRRFHDFYGWFAGYGYRPTRILSRMVVLWLACSVLYWGAADRFAAIGPANPAITSAALYPDADRLCGHGNEPGKTRWTECPGVPDEYSTFQPFIYSLDVILPLVDLQQEEDWAPVAEGPTGHDLWAGVIIRWVMWLEILAGWFASLMLIAIVSRLVEKD